MKIIIFALALALTSSVSAINIDRSVGGKFYVSSYSTADMYYNMDARQTINIYKFGYPSLFCGVASSDNPRRILASSYVNFDAMRFSASTKNLYLIVCIKSRGVSGDVILAIENVAEDGKRRIEQNAIDDSDHHLFQQLQDAMIEATE